MEVQSSGCRVEKSSDSGEIARVGYVFILTWVFAQPVYEYGMLFGVITGLEIAVYKRRTSGGGVMG